MKEIVNSLGALYDELASQQAEAKIAPQMSDSHFGLLIGRARNSSPASWILNNTSPEPKPTIDRYPEPYARTQTHTRLVLKPP